MIAARNRAAGFTLLEMLVALVILGFLMAGLTGGVRLGVSAWDRQARAVAGHAELDAVDRALRRLVEAADPGDRDHPAGVAGDGSHLLLTTILPQAVGGQEGETAVVVENRRLLLRWRPRTPGARAGPPTPPQEAELLRDVSGVRFAYLGPGGWQDVWDSADPPSFVRVRILFGNADPAARHWPDIVAALERMRER